MNVYNLVNRRGRLVQVAGNEIVSRYQTMDGLWDRRFPLQITVDGESFTAVNGSCLCFRGANNMDDVLRQAAANMGDR